jgi:tRNA(Ile2) C34 agmatinyltransferase TiaS
MIAVDHAIAITSSSIAAERCTPATSDSRRPQCDACGHPMEPEHAHYKCRACGYILPCCGW